MRRGIGILASTNATVLGQLREAAQSTGVELQIVEVSSANDLPGAFASMAQQPPDALMVLADTLFTANRPQLVQLATDTRIPTLYPGRSLVDAGGLMDYAYVDATRRRRAAEYVSGILHGANPAGLPMEPPTELELVVRCGVRKVVGC